MLVLDPGGAISASAAKPETHSGKKKAAQMGPPSLGRKRPRKQTARPRAALLRCTSYSPRSFVCNRVFATQQPENARHSYYWLVARRCGKFRVEETPTRPAIPAGCSRFRKTNEGRQPSRAPLRSRTPGAVIAGGLALPAHEAVWRGISSSPPRRWTYQRMRGGAGLPPGPGIASLGAKILVRAWRSPIARRERGLIGRSGREHGPIGSEILGVAVSVPAQIDNLTHDLCPLASYLIDQNIGGDPYLCAAGDAPCGSGEAERAIQNVRYRTPAVTPPTSCAIK